MSQGEIACAIGELIVVELVHLKWIWLEYRLCPHCRVKNLECDSPQRRLLKYL